MSARRAPVPFDRVRGAIALVLILALPALSGCLTATDGIFRDRDVLGVETSCSGPGGQVHQVPEVRDPYEKVRPGESGHVPPLTEGMHIAVLVPSGPTTDVERGIDLAIEELTAAGAKIDLDKRRVGGTDGVGVRAILNDTMKNGKPGVVISGLGDELTSELVWLARDREVPLLAAIADSARISSLQNTGGWFFRVPWTDDVEGRAAAELLWTNGCRSANLIVGPGERAADVATAFREAFTAKGGEVARVASLQAGASNARAAVQYTEFLQTGDRDKAPRPDSILVIAGPEESGVILREAYSSFVSSRSVLYFTESAYHRALVDTAGKDKNGHLLAADLRGTSAMAARTRATDAFELTFRTEYGLAPTNASARGYDATYVAVLAAACARDDHPATLRARMPQVVNDEVGDTDVSGADPLSAITTATARCGVNYVGASGDYDWNRDGEPVTGRYYYWTVGGDGGLRVTHSRVEPPAR